MTTDRADGHDARHERWIARRFGAEEGSLTDAERAAIEACSTCGPRIAELESLERGLAQAGAREREDLARARTFANPPSVARAEAIARAELRAPKQATPARWWLAAACVLVIGGAVSWIALRRDAAPYAPDVTLGDAERVDGLAPLGRVDAFGRFAWRGAVPSGGRFELHVHDAARSGPLDEPLEIATTQREEHTFAPSETARWPAAIRWKVRVFDASGQVVRESGWLDATR